MSVELEKAAKIAERYGRIFGASDTDGERGTILVRRTANAIANMIRKEIEERNAG